MVSACTFAVLTVLCSVPSVELYEFGADWCGSCQRVQPALEELAAQGVSVRQIDFDQHRQLAEQAGIRSLPSFLTVSDGRILGRMEGAVSLDELRKFVSRAEQQVAALEAVSTPSVVRGQAPESRGLGKSLADMMDRVRGSQSAVPTREPSIPSALSTPSTPYSTAAGKATPRPLPSSPTAYPADPTSAGRSAWVGAPAVANSPGPAVNQAPPAGQGDLPTDLAIHASLAATVRLRVKDPHGVSLGTGTIIDVHNDEALILTCGHIFEDANGQGEIRCDFFAENGPQDVVGKLISYNVRRDVGLVSVRPNQPVTAAPIAGPGYRPYQSDEVYTIGCNHGEDATVARNRILAVNRYHGPANLVVGGRPVNGRSGGGLFSADGLLIGVCNAADQEADEGLYAALGPIHAELDHAALGFVYRKQQSVLAQAPRTPPTKPASFPSTDRAPSDSPAASDPRPHQQRASALPYQTGQFPVPGETEVICIVRPKQPTAAGQTYVLDHPSPELLNQLSSELARRGRHQPTHAHQAIDDSRR